MNHGPISWLAPIAAFLTTAIAIEYPNLTISHSDGSATLDLTGTSQVAYEVESSPNLEQWTPLETVTTTESGSVQLNLPTQSDASFYRARALTVFPSVSHGIGITDIETLLNCSGSRLSPVGRVLSSDGKTWATPAAIQFIASPKATDLYNPCTGIQLANIAALDIDSVPIVEIDSDGQVITAYLFADNYFELYVNGTLVAVDPVPFTPFNSCVVRFKASYPITYALKLVDWEENAGLGTELNGGNPHHAGDGGFVAWFSDGTVTNADWKAQTYYIAPLADPDHVIELPNGTRDSSAASTDSNPGANSYAVHYKVPSHWYSKNYDDSAWPNATVYSNDTVGVNNKPSYTNFTDQFIGAGATFIWSSNLVLDNEVLVRFTNLGP